MSLQSFIFSHLLGLKPPRKCFKSCSSFSFNPHLAALKIHRSTHQLSTFLVSNKIKEFIEVVYIFRIPISIFICNDDSLRNIVDLQCQIVLQFHIDQDANGM
eukprot:TRINITY_DN2351_c2_g1_i1.p1 TRINITY_DN2351_c2_g1~~TRINITY_DN2351_c2_g1_i1.p1  ORF type:complete len:102 (-),score=11.00 TRINITY_DN2351_c2_g1_i1:335-640(-)